MWLKNIFDIVMINYFFRKKSKYGKIHVRQNKHYGHKYKGNYENTFPEID